MEVDIFKIAIIGSVILFLFGAFLVWVLLYHGKKVFRHKYEIEKLKTTQAEFILKESVSIGEKERERISRDLHDEIGPSLTLLKQFIHSLSIKYEFIEQDEREISLMLSDILNKLRSVSKEIYPSTIDTIGFIDTIKEFITLIKSTLTIDINVLIDAAFNEINIDEMIGLYRITLEFINNSIKHSNCSEIIIRGTIDHDLKKRWILHDNGIGFKVENPLNSGMGISNIRLRSKVINYSMSLKSSTQIGTTLELLSIN